MDDALRGWNVARAALGAQALDARQRAEAEENEAIRRVWLSANRPGVEKLVQAARRKGLRLTREKASRFIKAQSVAQIYAPSPASVGAVAARHIDSNWQADLVDLSQLPSDENDGHRYFLLCTNVFNRRCFAEPLKTKSPPEVAASMRKILSRAPAKPEIVSCDAGGEFSGMFEALLEGEGIVLKTKDPEDRNALAVVDRTIMTIKMGCLRRWPTQAMRDGLTSSPVW